jgi:hypothetical protein
MKIRPPSRFRRRALGFAVAVVLLGACAPYGRIFTASGNDRLRTAWYAEMPLAGKSSLVVLLANSRLDCTMPDATSPTAVKSAQEEIYLAMNREGARVVGLQLLSVDPSDWSGRYTVVADFAKAVLSSDTPRLAQAMYIGVDEAEVENLDGIYRSYYAPDPVYVFGVPAPGDVNVKASNDTVSGDFSLDAIDVSGTFEAESCSSESSILETFGYGR